MKTKQLIIAASFAALSSSAMAHEAVTTSEWLMDLKNAAGHSLSFQYRRECTDEEFASLPHWKTIKYRGVGTGLSLCQDKTFTISIDSQGGRMTTADWITTLMAVGTFCLAWYTRNLAKDTAGGIKQAERHHQEGLRPFCLIDFKYPANQDPFGIDWNSNSRLAEAKTRGEESPPPAGTIAIRGELRNKGKGLAKDVVLYLNKRLGRGEEHAYRLTRPVVVSGLIGAEEAVKIDLPVTEHDVMQVRDGSGWRPFETIQFIINDTYEVVLEYKDVFGNAFRTVHPRGLWHDGADAAMGDDKAKQHEMMISHNKPTPIFLAGKQAMRTAADINIPFSPQAHGPIEPGEPQELD